MTDKPGIRALGVAESTVDETCTVAGAVVRADRVVDGAAFASATVGGLDATDAVLSVVDELGREDLHVVLVGTVAPAWYNLLDLARLDAATDCPVVAVTFEGSSGLDAALREAFDGRALETRLRRYRALPPRTPCSVDGERVFVRALGVESAAACDLVRRFTPEGGRPEPIRVARTLARAGARYRDE
ncbi:DUF99 family protein [Halovivax limisalsi]|uniref:endonuclease dU n=1 Tax=Halovivax limisalsi TaxID=1453760 RepID=UPI001FFD76DA|nr:DUF99 family protein [Halovivax limisalsi]